MSESGEEGRFRGVQQASFAPKTSWNSNLVIQLLLAQSQARQCWDTEDWAMSAAILWPPMLVSQLAKQAWPIQVKTPPEGVLELFGRVGLHGSNATMNKTGTSLRKVIYSNLLLSH